MGDSEGKLCVSSGFRVESFHGVLNTDLQSMKEGFLLLQACFSQFCTPCDSSDVNDESCETGL